MSIERDMDEGGLRRNCEGKCDAWIYSEKEKLQENCRLCVVDVRWYYIFAVRLNFWTQRNLTEVQVRFLDAIVMTLLLEARRSNCGVPSDQR
jgi:hypothetical protein